MTTFQLDTSGEVLAPQGGWKHAMSHSRLAALRGSDLEPFTQGYIKAMFMAAWPNLFAEFVDKGMSEPEGHDDAVRPEFSDLASETLARIIEDCESFQAWNIHAIQKTSYQGKEGGRAFYEWRQKSAFAPYPPITLFLGNDGLARFR